MGRWDQQGRYSLFQIAVHTERLVEYAKKVATAYLRAFQNRPSRAEPLVELAKFHRLRSEFAQAYLYAKHAREMTKPNDRLFVDEASYVWRALDEVAISAYYVGTIEAGAVGASAAKALLSPSVQIPVAERDRIRANSTFYGT
jgi:hypothetical protein